MSSRTRIGGQVQIFGEVRTSIPGAILDRGRDGRRAKTKFDLWKVAANAKKIKGGGLKNTKKTRRCAMELYENAS
jgi:hypothetical protein